MKRVWTQHEALASSISCAAAHSELSNIPMTPALSWALTVLPMPQFHSLCISSDTWMESSPASRGAVSTIKLFYETKNRFWAVVRSEQLQELL